MLFLYMLVNFADYVEETLTYYRLPAGAPQAHEIDQHAGAVEPGDQTQHTLVRIFPSKPPNCSTRRDHLKPTGGRTRLWHGQVKPPIKKGRMLDM
jgi:hypothetical protein